VNEICTCVIRHTPPHLNVEHHHVLPQSWGGQGIDSTKPGFTRIVAICATTHNNEHLVLNQFVKLGRPPAPKELAAHLPGLGPKYRNFLLAMANEAWSHPDRPQKPPYTLAHGATA
jgi:hypothetical protein